MSKIICDVCGSAYSDTASVCPICGTAKTDKSKTFSNPGADETAAGSYTYVKGGRFSHSNVRKRSAGKELSRAAAPAPKQKAPEQQPIPEGEDNDTPSNRGLVIVVIILLLAIIAVCVYIGARCIELNKPGTNDPTAPNPSQGTVGGVSIPCSEITFDEAEIAYDTASGPLQLTPDIKPSNTTDEVNFSSSDETIATVDDEGNVTVLAPGQVTISVQCGEKVAQIVINCTVTDPNAPTDPTDPPAVLELTDSDITMNVYGATHQLYTGSIDASLITFTSDKPEVVTVDATGKITVVGKGVAVITAAYEDQTASCIVRCTTVEIPAGYILTYTDVTIKVGETLNIKLCEYLGKDEDGKDKYGAPVTDLNWTLSMEGYATITPTSTGVKVTGTNVTGPGVYYVRVLVEYEGVKYQCIIRVKSA